LYVDDECVEALEVARAGFQLFFGLAIEADGFEAREAVGFVRNGNLVLFGTEHTVFGGKYLFGFKALCEQRFKEITAVCCDRTLVHEQCETFAVEVFARVIQQAVDAEGRAHFRRFAFRSHQRGNNNQKKVPEIVSSHVSRLCKYHALPPPRF
jgi:hypothetical protein